MDFRKCKIVFICNFRHTVIYSLACLLALPIMVNAVHSQEAPESTPLPLPIKLSAGQIISKEFSIPEEWHEDPDRLPEFVKSLSGGDTFQRALRLTGMAEHLTQRQEVSQSASTANWICTGPVGKFGYWGDNGRVAGLDFAQIGGQNYVYAGASSGGIWRANLSTNGDVWQSLGDNLPNQAVRALAVHPTNPQRILVGTGDPGRYRGGGMYLTDNGGGSWTSVPMNPTPEYFYRIRHCINNPQFMLAASDNGLWRSTNGGDHWTQKLTGIWTDLVLHPTNGNIMYAVQSGKGIYKSITQGDSWTQLSSPNLPATTDWGRSALALCRDAPDTVALAVERNGNVHGVYRTTDGGTSWTNITSDLGSGTFGNGQASHVLSLAFRPSDINDIILGVDNIARSYWDTSTSQIKWHIGETAADMQVGHADITGFVFSPLTGDNLIWISNDGGLFYHIFSPSITVSYNGNSSTGLAISQIDFFDADRSMLAMGLQDNGSLRSVDGGAAWTRLKTGDGGGVVITDPEHLDEWLWEGVPWNIDRAIYGQEIERLAHPGGETGIHFDPVARKVWAGNGKAILSAGAYDNPVAWTTEISSGLHTAADYAVRRVWGSKLESGTLFVDFGWWHEGDLTTVHRSGSSWVINGPRTMAPGGRVNQVTQSSEWLGEAWAGCRSNPGQPKIFHTTDYGQNWQDISGTLAAVGSVFNVLPQPFAPNRLYAATDIGVFLSQDGGQTWQPFQEGLPVVAVTNMYFVIDDAKSNVHKLRISTYGRGTWVRNVIAPPVIYVDENNVGSEDGTFEHPWKTVTKGINAAPYGAIVAVRSNVYNEPQIVTKNVTLMTYCGVSIIR